MGIIVFWSVLAFVYLSLAVVTGIALYNLKQKLCGLDTVEPAGIFDKKGEVVPVSGTLYRALKAILITDVIGFLAAMGAAIVAALTN